MLKALRYALFVAALLLSAALLVKVIQHLPPSFEENYLPSLLSLLFIIISATFALSRPSLSEKEFRMLSLLFGCFWALSLLWIFKGVPFALGGGKWDSWFHHAMAANFKHFWKSTDFNYQGLSSFYPFLYQYVAGKVAWALSAPPYTVLKYSVILAAALLPFLLYISWRSSVEPATSLLITALSIFPFLHFFLYKPYEFLPLVFLIPWWWFYVEEGGSFKKNLLGGIFGGIMFASYYLWFFPVILLAATESLISAISLKASKKWWVKFRGKFAVLSLTAMFSSFYWFPLLLDLIGKGGISLQNKWFKAQDLIPFLPVSSFSLKGVLSLLGLVFVFAAWKEELAARRIGKFILSLYLTILISNFLVLLRNPLPNFRLNQMLLLAYLIGFALALEHFKLWGQETRKYASLALSLVLFSSTLMRVPSVKNSRLFRLSASSKVLNLEKRKELGTLSGKTVLNLPPRVMVFVPIKRFIAPNPFYSHPSAHLGKRLAFLYLLQFSGNQNFFFFSLRKNKFCPVDYIYLKGKTLKIRAFYENFPHKKLLSVFKFNFKFINRRNLEPLFKDVVEKGDLIGRIPASKLDATALSPLEKFIAAKFISRRFKPEGKILEYPWVKVFLLGKHLLFYKEKCPRERWKNAKFAVKTEGFSAEVSLKDGLLTSTCAMVVPLPSSQGLEIFLKN